LPSAIRSGDPLFSSEELEILDIILAPFRLKSGAATNPYKIEKSAPFHNAKLRLFWTKNTISCGGFNLPTKPVVACKNHSSPVLGSQIQLAFRPG
jgi:hypothetical protein